MTSFVVIVRGISETNPLAGADGDNKHCITNSIQPNLDALRFNELVIDGPARKDTALSPPAFRDKGPLPSKYSKTAKVHQGLGRPAALFKRTFRSVNGINGSCSVGPRRAETANILHQNLPPIAVSPQWHRPRGHSRPSIVAHSLPHLYCHRTRVPNAEELNASRCLVKLLLVPGVNLST